MEKVNGSIITNESDAQNEDMLFTYDENEKQQNETNASNASLVFSPKFIPIYPELLDKLTLTEALIFGFIDFYKSNNSARFYFTNEQIAAIAHCNPSTASEAISKIESLGFIKTSRKVRAGGGTIRFITDVFYKSDFGKSSSPTSEKAKIHFGKSETNNNKINNNKINSFNTNVLKEKTEVFSSEIVTFGNTDINEGIQLLKESGTTSRIAQNRYALHRLYTKHGKDKVLKVFRYALKIRSMSYAPAVYNFMDLEEKWPALEAYAAKQMSKLEEQKKGVIDARGL